MNVVELAVELGELGSEVHADTGDDATQVVQDLIGEDAAPRFVDLDQVHVH